MRLDQLLVERGLFASREQARRSVMAGAVEVDGRRVDKPGAAVDAAAALAVREREPFVSRGGRKLAGALDAFGIDPAGRVCLDIGASTGGFTDCLLQRGARRVYAFDVGHGLLDARLRADPRVVLRERFNARHLEPGDVPEPVALAVFDVSFISLLKVVPPAIPLVAPGGLLLPLVKPQFEVGRAAVGKGGVVRDESVRREIVRRRAAELVDLGLELVAESDSRLPGADGNREVFLLLRRPA
ncbi:MAG TPA: TlyA family RNA methyltransferase [Thermoanaerobaculia bacterium]|nr:TlyA family RNA methyltransferase [Thermoanaerobaculia bacterium]HNU83414.1 TlyA family RNA methyltransferase [Thermoanaerobaculia bacterium]HNZ96782.1 TlyA family RNA methyltransferase [Thermoanaerobaculia bacterium]HPA95420.1 TlyA family RNA methyltransferase [Thermoanaerobaculia bacterium]HQP93328.1 TlyA family RNA methyltransferase [Thermoanaerobaculia bacterium]